MSTKFIIMVKLLAVQSPYFLAQAEGIPAWATEKARSMVVCDTWVQSQDCCLSRNILLSFPTYPCILGGWHCPLQTHLTWLYYTKRVGQAASTLELEYNNINGGYNLILQPFQAVSKLVRLAMTSCLIGIRRGGINPLGNIWRIRRRVTSRWRKWMKMNPMQQEWEWIERGKNLT